MTNPTEKQKEIINCAIDLIASNGFKNLTIKKISSSIGVSEPAIYRHFKSKTEILTGILSDFREKVEKSTLDNAQFNSLKAIEKIESLVKTHFTIFSEHPEYTAILFAEEFFRGDPEIGSTVSEILKRNQATIIQIIESGQSGRHIRKDIPALHLSTLIMGSLRLTVTRWRMSGHKDDLVKAGNEIWEALRKMITG
ncbi:MAG: TetR/AcrR family transcriptional regulator [Fibrobacterota bacterium]